MIVKFGNKIAISRGGGYFFCERKQHTCSFWREEHEEDARKDASEWAALSYNGRREKKRGGGHDIYSKGGGGAHGDFEGFVRGGFLLPIRWCVRGQIISLLRKKGWGGLPNKEKHECISVVRGGTKCLQS